VTISPILFTTLIHSSSVSNASIIAKPMRSASSLPVQGISIGNVFIVVDHFCFCWLTVVGDVSRNGCLVGGDLRDSFAIGKESPDKLSSSLLSLAALFLYFFCIADKSSTQMIL
jgi:hypothetical protein